ncbi:MAG: glycosyltransferase [Chitinivibrionales bacterium]|nr:glycosyltransferase [Chitinivibrionales bacterium]
MRKRPLLSIVIPVYNGEAYIADCLASVCQQTVTDYEVIIVDDGSTDNSLDIIKKAALKKRIYRQRNKDVSAARNRGISHAMGEYIALLDHDDVWVPNKLERQIEALHTDRSVDLVFTDIVKFFPSGKESYGGTKTEVARAITPANAFEMLLQKNVLMPSAVMFKKSSFYAAGGFDERFKTCGDYELWLRMASYGMHFHFIDAPLTRYRYHGENNCRRTARMHRDRVKAVRKTFMLPHLDESQRSRRNSSLARVYALGAGTFFSIKRYRQFILNFEKAMRYDYRVVTAKLLGRYVRSMVFASMLKKP